MGQMEPSSPAALRLRCTMTLLMEHQFREWVGELAEKLNLGFRLKLVQRLLVPH